MWQNCLDRIKAQTSEEEFVKWFQPIVPLEFDGTNLRLRVPNESYVHQIEKNYIPFLRPIISQLYGQQTRLHYAVPRATAPAVPVAADADTTAISRFNAQTNTANIKNPFVIPGLKKIIIDPQLNPNYTFSTFIEGECNRLARSAGMSVAVNPGTTQFACQISIKLKSFFVDNTSLRHNSRPTDGKPVTLQSQLFHQSDILSVTMIMITSLIPI